MPPLLIETFEQTKNDSTVLSADLNDGTPKNIQSKEVLKAAEFKHQYNWVYIFVLGYFHLSGMYGVYLMFMSAKLYTDIYSKYLFR